MKISRKVDGSLKKSVIKNIQKKRKSDIVWMNDRWIYKEIHPLIHQANKKQVGILIGLVLSLANLQNMSRTILWLAL